MAKADNSITIGVELDTSELQKNLSKAKQELENFDKNNNLKVNVDDKELYDLKNEIEQSLGEDFFEISPILELDDEQIINEINKLQLLLLQKSDELDRELMLSPSIDEEKVVRLKNEIEAIAAKIDLISEGRTGKINNDIKSIADNTDSLKNSLKDFPKSIDKISSKITGVVRKIGRLAIALIGIRTLTNLLQQSFSTLSQYNTELSNKMQSARLVLAVGLEPVIKRIVSLVETLLSLLNYLSKGLFGVDLFAKAAEYATKNTAENLGAGASAAAEIKKSLAGFDEMNILQNTSASGGAGAGGGGSTSGFEFNLEENDLWKNWNLKSFIEKGKEIAKNIAEGINDFLKNTDFKEIGKKVSEGLIGAIDIIDTFIKNVDWAALGESLVNFFLGFDWIGFIKSLWNLIKDAILAVFDFTIGWNDAIANELMDPSIRTKINRFGKDLGNDLLDGLLEILAKINTELLFSIMKRLGAESRALGIAIEDINNKFASWVINKIQGTDIDYAYLVALQKEYNETSALIFAIEDLDSISRQYSELKDKLTSQTNSYIRAIDGETAAQEKLTEAQDRLGISGEELQNQVDNGTLSYKEMSVEQKEVYKAYVELKDATNRANEAEKEIADTNKKMNWLDLKAEMKAVQESVDEGKTNWKKYAEDMVNSWKNGKMEAQDAGDRIMFAMGQMDDKTREVFQKSIPKKLSDAYKMPDSLQEIKDKIEEFNDIAAQSGGGIHDNVKQEVDGASQELDNFIKKYNDTKIKMNVEFNAKSTGMKSGGIVSLPRLATGAIINQPGRGIPVGGGQAYAGEAGREGIIPLTDNQAMETLGRAIGRYVNINATIPVKIGDRQVAREVRNIMAESDFAYNR